jgi:hypothetical protein
MTQSYVWTVVRLLIIHQDLFIFNLLTFVIVLIAWPTRPIKKVKMVVYLSIPADIGAGNAVGAHGRCLIFAQSRGRRRPERHFGLVDKAIKDQAECQAQNTEDR